MGKYIIAGNWKMNKLPSETYDFVKEVVEAQNEFILCYTKAGSSSPNYIDTEVGLWEINYFEQY